MLAFILTLAATAADDVLRSPGPWEGRSAAADAPWQRPGAAREAGVLREWVELRTTFAVDAEPEEGTWLVVAGPVGVPVEAAWNGQPMERISDPLAGRDGEVGPAFRLSHRQLQAQEHALTLRFPEGGAARCVQDGPTYLLSPRLARIYRERLQEWALTSVENLATRVLSSGKGHVASRVLFRQPDQGALATAGLVDLRLVDERRERDLPSLSPVQVTGEFPLFELQAADPAFPGMDMFVRCFAPLSPERPAESLQPLVMAELSNRVTRTSFTHEYHLRLFPSRGGPLKVRERDGLVALGNDEVVLFATNAKVLGTEEEPTGLALTLDQDVGPSGRPNSLMGPREIWGVTAPTREQRERPRQHLRELSALTEDYNGLLAKTANWGNSLLFLADEQWAQEDLFPTSLSRTLAREMVQHLRDQLSVPAFQEAPRRRYWDSLMVLLHLPDQERRFLQLLVDQDIADPVAATYACLRAARYLRWQEDPERAAAWLPRMREWLARGAESGPAADTALQAARLAAGSAVAELLRQTGAGEDAEALEGSLAADLDHLLGPPAEGGRVQDGHLVSGPAENPQGLAECLALGILPEEAAEALAVVLEEALPEQARVAELDDVLGALALLQTGRLERGATMVRQLGKDLGRYASPPENCGALYALLVHGIFGVRKPACGVLELRPVMDLTGMVRLSIPVGEGILSLHLDRPDRSLFRKIAVTNTSGTDLRVIFAVPGRLGPGPKVQQGERQYSLYECTVEDGGRYRDEIR